MHTCLLSPTRPRPPPYVTPYMLQLRRCYHVLLPAIPADTHLSRPARRIPIDSRSDVLEISGQREASEGNARLEFTTSRILCLFLVRALVVVRVSLDNKSVKLGPLLVRTSTERSMIRAMYLNGPEP